MKTLNKFIDWLLGSEIYLPEVKPYNPDTSIHHVMRRGQTMFIGTSKECDEWMKLN